MITPLIKDKVLNALCDLEEFETLASLNLKSALEATDVSFNELNSILNHFERLGFVSNINLRRQSQGFYITIHLEALDFKNRGGFFVQEEVLKLTLEKLQLEINQLSNEFPDKAQNFTAIAANIATCLTFLIATK